MVIAAFGSLGLVGVFVSACGSSSSGADGDSGAHDSSSKPDGDGKEDTATDASTKDVVKDASVCKGLADAAAGLTFAPACLACLGAGCCMQAQACAEDSACKAILACEATCVAGGTTGITCATMCIKGDSGVDATADLDPAQNAAYALDECLIGMGCSGACM
jgi:hypothetical protein